MGGSVTPARGEEPASGPTPGLNTVSGSEPAAAPGYFPRLLSAAAHVKHIASDSALDRFGLNRDSFHLLGCLASAPATEAELAKAAGQSSTAIRVHLLQLQSSGYSARDGSGIWSVTEAGLNVMECANLAQAEATLDAEDSQELRQALRTLISSLRLEQPEGGTQKEP
ncbi:MarR family winged helix-turn-helix transcriptional regulator [Arthrobacter sp. zg-Y1171]|uniref:MarR family winged helix-turn-helix transcriptional regulator n=1 Tax=Arthrobacter sp. zg-Y1171 TaxID=2964610 RepID=UPI002103BA7D|nr:MarR family winged helix-turn-helix transcriptional regulator [Arthrobacter sp. zg-Y1171]MCQ1994153.1 MarR family winged helix-turn-helix transcriptional regulator [Arthrobacter sp. zg-Y1171]UWX81745.1 MarR family winged helix-turn-helix transcriptional regulator [Arthrobacter sp. zg-Y1171]